MCMYLSLDIYNSKMCSLYRKSQQIASQFQFYRLIGSMFNKTVILFYFDTNGKRAAMKDKQFVSVYMLFRSEMNVF